MSTLQCDRIIFNVTIARWDRYVSFSIVFNVTIARWDRYVSVSIIFNVTIARYVSLFVHLLPL